VPSYHHFKFWNKLALKFRAGPHSGTVKKTKNGYLSTCCFLLLEVILNILSQNGAAADHLQTPKFTSLLYLNLRS